MNNTKISIFLLLTGFLQAVSMFSLIIKYAISHFQPVTNPDIFIPVARAWLKPEIDIPLYLLGILFIPTVGYFLYKLSKFLLGNIPNGAVHYFAAIYFKMTLCLLFSISWIMANRSLIYLYLVFSAYIVLIYFTYAFLLILPNKLAAIFARLSIFLDVVIISAAIAFLAILFKLIFFTNYFLSADFINLVNYEAYYYFKGFNLIQFSLVSIVFSTLFLFYIHLKVTILDLLKNKYFKYLVDIAAFFFIFFFVSIIVSWNRQYASGMFNYAGVIGVVNDILGGKTILVDSYSQYGLLMPYIVSIIFLFIPLSYFTFFYLNYVSTIVGFVLLYFSLRKLFKGHIISFFWLFLIPLHHYITQQTNILFTGQNTFLRWGWWIFLFLFLLYKDEIFKNKKFKSVSEYVLVAIGTFWAFDIGLYILFAYIFYIVVDNLMLNTSFLNRMISISKSLFACGISLLAIFSLINIFSLARSGQFPQWSEYLFHTRLFAISGYGLAKLPNFGPYIFIILFELGIITYILYTLFEESKHSKGTKEELPIIGFLSAYALLQFLYYIGESLPGNLHLTIIPSLILFCWVFYRIPFGKIFYTNFLNISEKILMGVEGIVIIILFLILSTIAVLNTINAYKLKGPITFYPKPEYMDDKRYIDSIRWLNIYLKDIPPHDRKIAVISEQDWVFLLESKSTNIIDSGNNYYFHLVSQYHKLCNQLYERHPRVLFMQNDNGWGWTDILRGCVYKKYHFVENVGFLNRWELN